MKNNLILNNIYSMVFHLFLAFFSLLVYGAAEPGLVKSFPFSDHYYQIICLFIVFFFASFYFAFGYFLLKANESLIANLSSVLGIILLSIILWSSKSQLSLFLAYPFIPLSHDTDVVLIDIFLSLLPPIFMFMGMQLRSKKHSLKFILSAIVIFILLWFLPFLHDLHYVQQVQKVNNETKYIEILSFKPDFYIPLSTWVYLFGQNYGTQVADNFTFVKTEEDKRNIERIFHITLPKIDFTKNYYVVSKGTSCKYEDGGVALTKLSEPNIIKIYRVNIVKPDTLNWW